jgi:hypothetical protein
MSNAEFQGVRPVSFIFVMAICGQGLGVDAWCFVQVEQLK